MHVGGTSFDDDVEREHEESADKRSVSTLALSSFNGSWCIGIFSICKDDLRLNLQNHFRKEDNGFRRSVALGRRF